MRRQANLFPSWSYITLAGWLYPWAKSKFTQKGAGCRTGGQQCQHFSDGCWHVSSRLTSMKKKLDSLKYGPLDVSFFWVGGGAAYNGISWGLGENMCQKIKMKTSSVRGQDIEWICRVNERAGLYFYSHQDVVPPNKSDMTSAGLSWMRRQMWLGETSQ